VIIDTDPGVDDLVALALAARAPGIELVAVTTTYGNAPLEATTRNARHLLSLAGRPDVPVVAGSAAPLRRAARTAPARHGPDGAGEAPVPPATPVASAPAALADVLAGVPGPLTLVTMGPLTNLAAAIGRTPHLLRDKIERHVGMFGNLGQDSEAVRHADFNTWCDPEAADRVLRARLPTTMVTLDASRHAFVPADWVARARASRDPLASWLGAALWSALRYDAEHRRIPGVLLHDVLTIAGLLEPSVLECRDSFVTVSLDEGEDRGHTREAREGVPVRVTVGADVRRMRELLAPVLG
jgi:inosine-uridine nucleoside N-ribohydrolase